jgi:serine/threonine-protein kinase
LTNALPPDPRVGKVLAERYRIDSVIGEGAMGKVYAAEHVLMRKRLAVKVLHRELSSVPELVARFEREAMAAANIDHPNIAGATDFGKLPDGAVFLALELVEGRCLRDELAEGRFPTARALHVTRQIASALGAAHAQGIVHRDLKPENVMLVERGGDPDFVKVLDFGVARVPIGDGAEGSDVPGPITRAGMVFGTPEYIPPEQALGQQSDGRADLYSLGVMLFEMLAGTRPFTAETKVSLVGQHIGKAPPRVSDRVPSLALPDEVEALVAKLLEKEVARRVQNADEVITAINRLIGKPTRGPFRPVRPVPRKTDARRPFGGRLRQARELAESAFGRASAFVGGLVSRLPPPVRKPLERVGPASIAAGLLGIAGLGLVLAIVGLASGGRGKLERVALGTGERTSAVAASASVSDASAPPSASAPAARLVPGRDPSEDELAEAVKSGLVSLQGLAERFPRSATVLAEIGRAQVAKQDYAAGVAAVTRALELDAEVRRDPRVAGVLFQAAQSKATSAAAFKLLEGPMRERGAAIEHDLAVYAPSGSPAQRHAEAFLGSPRFTAVAEPALQLAVALRRARSCTEVRALLPEVKTAGDRTSLPYLKFFRERLSAYPCLKTDTLLADTTRAVELRAKP